MDNQLSKYYELLEERVQLNKKIKEQAPYLIEGLILDQINQGINSAKELAAKLGITGPGISQKLTFLINNRFVMATTGTDKRAKVVTITIRGVDFLNQIKGKKINWGKVNGSFKLLAKRDDGVCSPSSSSISRDQVTNEKQTKEIRTTTIG